MLRRLGMLRRMDFLRVAVFVAAGLFAASLLLRVCTISLAGAARDLGSIGCEVQP